MRKLYLVNLQFNSYQGLILCNEKCIVFNPIILDIYNHRLHSLFYTMTGIVHDL